MLVRFMSCRERFRLKYVVGLEPHDKWNKIIGYGNMWHVCEEVHAATKYDAYGRPDRSWRGVLQSHCMEIAHGRPPNEQEDIAKWMQVCNVQFPEYVKYWAEHPDVKNRTPLMQEQVFDVPYELPSGRVVRLRGKFDSVDVITDETTGPWGGIYLQENKTKGDIDKLQIERQLQFDLQTLTYIIALQKLQEDVKGVRYNVVRRPLSGGVGNIRPHGDKTTKAKVIPAETNEEFYERLRRDYIAADPAYWFFRVRSEVSVRDVRVFCKTCLDPLLEQLCWWYDEVTNQPRHISITNQVVPPFMNYRTPFGIYNPLAEGGATEYDAYLASGSEAGLRRVETLFGELQ